MTIDELASELKSMHAKAADKEIAVTIHLFGIKFSSALKNSSVREVVERSGLDKSYGTEVRKGMNLAKYVQLK